MRFGKSVPLSSARVFLWIKKSAAIVAALVSRIQISARTSTLRCSSCWKYVRRDKTGNKSAAVYPLNDIKPVNQDLFDLHDRYSCSGNKPTKYRVRFIARSNPNQPTNWSYIKARFEIYLHTYRDVYKYVTRI